MYKRTRQRRAEDRARGALYPPLAAIRQVSARVACAVAKKAYEAGVATELPKPHDIMATIDAFMYRGAYRNYR